MRHFSTSAPIKMPNPPELGPPGNIFERAERARRRTHFIQRVVLSPSGQVAYVILSDFLQIRTTDMKGKLRALKLPGVQARSL